MSTTVQNTPETLFQQFLQAIQPQPVNINYDAIVRTAIRVIREERERMVNNPRIVVTQNEAHTLYGKQVINALVRRGILQKYKFDIKEVYDKEGELIKKAKGVVYYRILDIESAIEEGNVLKGVRRSSEL